MRLEELATTRSPKPAVTSSLLTRRQILKAGLAVTGLGFVTGCRNQSGKSVHRIAVPLQGMTAEFMQLWDRGAQAHPAIKNGLATFTVFDGRMDALTPDDMATLVRDLRAAGLAESTITAVLGTVGRIYRYAARRLGWVGISPVSLALSSTAMSPEASAAEPGLVPL